MLSTAKQAAMFVPHVVMLAARLANDDRVPVRAKALLAAAAVYFASPLDLLPDWIPVIGQLDDLLLAALVIDVIINHVDPAAVREHWRGSPRALAIGGRIAAVICFFIPSRLKRRIFLGGSRERTPDRQG
ncbi:MAG TPA: YkvA family protein [Planctomycetota bacterium]|nr:YkvA family protein [Planctomycetota bacterium]